MIMKENIKNILKITDNIHKEMINDIDSSEVRWQEKKVENSKVLFIPSKESFQNVSKPSTGNINLSNELLLDGIETLEIKTNTLIKNKFSRPTCGITINLDKQTISNFNRVSVWINIKSTGFQNFYFHFKLGTNGNVHTASIVPNKWTRVMWELEEDNEKEIDKIQIIPFIFGCPPEAESEVSFYVGKVCLEKVKPDYVLGWKLDDRIAYCHSGYYINSEKQALTQFAPDKRFYIIDETNEVVYKNDVKEVESKLGKFYLLDFTDFKEEGVYKLAIDNRTTPLFEISNDPFMASILKSVNFLRLLRCGEDIEGVHSACHLNCRTVHENGNSVPNFGGWHDAGDVSQFEICTAEMANAILDLVINTKDEQIKNRLLEEAKVGLNWLLRTRFTDGSRALAVSYSIWRKNELENDDTSVLQSKAEKGPFESFCSASALAVAVRCYDDKIFTDWCKRVAIEDFNFAREWYKEGIHTARWGKNIDSQVSGVALLAASELYLVTKDHFYLDCALEYSNIIMKCQETNYLENSKIRGFFYEDVDHKYVLAYEHRGHEQSPIQGLCRILQVYPEITNKMAILNCIILYKEYVLSTLNETYPYNLVPAHVYNINKINAEHFTIPSYVCTIDEGIKDMQNQIKHGIKINDDWYLRIFPAAVQRRGFHATLLSKTKALSIIYKTLNDDNLRQIIINQLEWILGKNPFASSTMYGEGHNYHPLYVAFSRQMVGALPVGIMTKGDLDLPYWPTYNNAVFKEIWGHTTGKYLWVLADLM